MKNGGRRRPKVLRWLVIAHILLASLVASLEIHAGGTRARRRPVTRPVVQMPVQSWYVVERSDADFGVVHPGDARELDGAIIIRVFSDSGWTLSIASMDMTISSGAMVEPIGARRISTRANQSEWRELNEALPTILARGIATPRSGETVIVDLRITLEDVDPSGRLGGHLEIILEPM